MPDPAPLSYRRPNQCLFCTSRRCFTRIVTEDGSFDEVACARHVAALERHFDAGGRRTMLHTSGSSKKRRGNVAELFARSRASIREFERWRAEKRGREAVSRAGAWNQRTFEVAHG